MHEPKTPSRPIVKFCDIDTDLLQSITGVKGSSQDTDPTNDDEFDPAENNKHQNVVDFAFQGSDRLTEGEVSLKSPLLLDLLLVDPVSVSQRTPLATAPQKNLQVT